MQPESKDIGNEPAWIYTRLRFYVYAQFLKIEILSNSDNISSEPPAARFKKLIYHPDLTETSPNMGTALE